MSMLIDVIRVLRGRTVRLILGNFFNAISEYINSSLLVVRPPRSPICSVRPSVRPLSVFPLARPLIDPIFQSPLNSTYFLLS